MGIQQMAESEAPGSTISKAQEKPRKTSTESSQSPKAAQPSCLRGAFIRIFLKRAEPNNKTEEDPISNRNTEDQEGVRGKKRRVTGSIFRLPCLRPAETTGNDNQDKTEEQGNDTVQEEELKPYSKASFLRKIRCYRLMREKDATEKEKVIEMVQRKHDKENAEVKQCKERVLEQKEEGLQSSNQEEVMEEKRKDTTEQGSHAKSLGEAGNDSEEEDFNVEKEEKSLRKQECCTEKLPGEELVKTEDLTLSVGGMGEGLAEQESCVETRKEKSLLLEGEGSLQEDKKIAKQERQIEKIEQEEQVGKQEEVMIEPRNCAAKVSALDNALSDNVSQPEEVERQEKQEEAMEKDLPKQDTEDVEDAMKKSNPENKCHTDTLEDSGNYVSEREEVGNTENNGSGRQHLKENMEQDGQKEKGVQEEDMTELKSQGDIADKIEDKVLEKDSREEIHAGVGGGQENNLVDRDSYTKNADNSRKQISQPGSQYIVKDGLAKTLGEVEDKPVEVSEVYLDVQDEHNVTNNTPKQELTMAIMNQESVTCYPQDSSAKRTLGSEDNEELLTPVIKKTSANNILTCASSEEVHTHVVQLQKEILTNAMDLTYREAHTCIGNKDDGMGCESADLGSLRVEVQDMVEWLVQEASDRISHYTQETEGTG